MDPTEVLAAVTAFWAMAMALSPALQIRQMRRTRSSRDVSLGYFTVLVVGFVLWVLYGLSKNDPVLFVPNAIAAAVGSATVVVAVYYRRQGGHE